MLGEVWHIPRSTVDLIHMLWKIMYIVVGH